MAIWVVGLEVKVGLTVKVGLDSAISLEADRPASSVAEAVALGDGSEEEVVSLSVGDGGSEVSVAVSVAGRVLVSVEVKVGVLSESAETVKP